MNPIPFHTIDWTKASSTEHPGERGTSFWRTVNYDGLRIRMVEYSPDYLADHWCELGHILFCVKGELQSELADGSIHTLKENMSYHVSDRMSKHRSISKDGVLLFIVDGEFLNIPSITQGISAHHSHLASPIKWFEREFKFGQPPGMLPFYLERLSSTSVRMEQKVKHVSNDLLSEKRNGKWSIKENIGHLAEVDEIAMKRIEEMLTGAAQLSPAVYEPRNDYNKLPIDEVINIFTTNRNANLKKYSVLSEMDLVKTSLHPRLNMLMNPVDLAMFDAEHDDHHLVTINEILRQSLK